MTIVMGLCGGMIPMLRCRNCLEKVGGYPGIYRHLNSHQEAWLNLLPQRVGDIISDDYCLSTRIRVYTADK